MINDIDRNFSDAEQYRVHIDSKVCMFGDLNDFFLHQLRQIRDIDEPKKGQFRIVLEDVVKIKKCPDCGYESATRLKPQCDMCGKVFVEKVTKSEKEIFSKKYYIRAISAQGYKYLCSIILSTNDIKHLQKKLDEKLKNVDGENRIAYGYKIYEFYEEGSSKIVRVEK